MSGTFSKDDNKNVGLGGFNDAGDAVNASFANDGKLRVEATVTGSATSDTELPAATADSDGIDPSTSSIFSLLYGFNPSDSKWYRLEFDGATSGLIVKIANTVPVSATQLPSALTGSGNLKTSIQEQGLTLGVSGTVDTTRNAVSGAAGAWTRINSGSSYVTHKIIKNAAGRLKTLVVYNSKASAQFVQIHNSATQPANGATPEWNFAVPATTSMSFNFDDDGDYYSSGIVVCNSSTALTATSGSADIQVEALYS